ncbi:MAG TPA: hypothetical protein VGQ37_11045 [Vicinamibacterales bacterium]|jgi:hypothetical protein|nr:hypothetical protein [Vicinamibacterales bacterium]
MTKICGLSAAVTLAALVCSSPAFAQADMDGTWQPRYHEDQPERIPGPELKDYLGLPINDAARQFADSWDPGRIALPEEQCRVHVSPYIYRGPTNLRIWEEKHPKTQDVIALKHYHSTYEQTRTIWMDGRPHPGPNAAHTWMGFSTGRWDGDMLVIETTHLKQGWVRRNGLPMSDQAHMTEYWVRNSDLLTQIVMLFDPVYLTEPLVKSTEFVRSPRELPAGTWLWVCDPVVEIATREEGAVPSYLPGEHPFEEEFGRRHGVPAVATRGGAVTMYPEFQDVVKQAPKPAPLPPPSRGATRVTGPGQQQQGR